MSRPRPRSIINVEHNYNVNINVFVCVSGRTLQQNNGSVKDKLDSPILQTCVGEEGKLLVKVIKATGLCAKDNSAAISPYCIISADNPYQRKRTSLIKDTDSPFWNEYFAFDITSKTREITLNIFDFEKTPSDVNYHMDDDELSAEQDDFLGQAIVPLATVNRNQTCRLILPILPKTNKCDYVKGELSLEFTFDKDGKVIDGALPLVDITDSSAKATAVEHTVYDVTVDKTQATPSVNDTPPVNKNYGGAYAYSLDKSYMETSLDELAQEIEAYEAQGNPTRPTTNEEKSVEILMKLPEETEKQHEKEHAEAMEEVAALDATLAQPVLQKGEDAEDNKPSKDEDKHHETEHNEETAEEKPKAKKSLFKRRPKSTIEGDKKDKELDTNRHSYHAGDEPLDETTTETKEDEPKQDAEEQPAELNREPKSKIRRSFNMKFGRGSKKDKESPTQETDAAQPHDDKKEQEAVEESLKSDPPKSRFSGRFKRKDKKPHKADEQEEKKDEPKSEEKDDGKDGEKKEPNESEDKEKAAAKKEEKKDEETKQDKKELETVDENAESSTSEKTPEEQKSKFRKLNLKRGNKRPVSMIDTKPIEEENKLDPVTHSYHAGDLPETSQLRKSNSQSSLLSYSPNPFSSLIIEVKDKDEKKYYHIPVSMAKRGTYEQKGVKYHVYNDHMFKAVHFDESTNCAVCQNSISGLFGKQGYQCKGCKMATHKKCHFQTSDMCSAGAAKNIDIENLPDLQI